MISSLLEVLLSNDLTPTDKAVFVFLDGMALALMFAGVDWLVTGKPWGPAVAFFLIAFVLALIAHNWSTLKPKLGRRLSGTAYRIERIAGDYRYRTGSLFLVAFIIGIIFLSYVYPLRQELEMYVMPRVVTEEQASKLRKFLSANPSDVKLKIFCNVADTEALEYASQLYNAIMAGGWEAQFQPANPWDDVHPGMFGKQFSNIFVVMEQGIAIRTCLAGQPVNPDPKHPTPDAILGMALERRR